MHKHIYLYTFSSSFFSLSNPLALPTPRFKNTGNTCYMNACLKVLTSLAPFTHYLLHERLLTYIPPTGLARYYAAHDIYASIHMCVK